MKKSWWLTLINITGLSIGIACSVLIMLFVLYEKSYEKFYPDADRTYRIAVSAMIGDTKINQTYTSAITFLTLLKDFPEIEVGTKICNFGQTKVDVDDRTFFESRFLAVDSTFFNVFPLPLIHGDPEQVLTAPKSMVINRSTALKYFGDVHVVGKIIKADFGSWAGIIPFQITGISEDVPANSHMHYDILISLTTFPDFINNTGWTSNNFSSYFRLHEGTSKDTFNTKLVAFTRKYMSGGDLKMYDEMVAKGNYWINFLQPVRDIHLKSDLNGEFEPNGNKAYVDIFFIVSIIVLLIACINFMNLSTARQSIRAREVGVRKVVGSSRRTIIRQFFGESLIISFLSLVIAMTLVENLLPAYRNLVGRQIEIHYFDNGYVIPLLLLFGIVVGIISGSYPALYLSSFKPVSLLKSKSGEGKTKAYLRNGLVLLQFTITVFMIIGTLTIFRQLKYLQNKDLGFKKEQVLVINNPTSMGSSYVPFREALLSNPSIENVTASGTLPGKSFANWGFGAEGVDKQFTLNTCICDYDFLTTLGITLEQGRFFSRDFPSDSCAALLNETAARLLGWDNAVGKKINNWSMNRGNFTVIGVIKDYHYESLHQEVRPQALFLSGGYYRNDQTYISLRLKTDKVTETVNMVRDTWNKFVPGMPFDYFFLEDEYNKLYSNEMLTRKIFSIFSFLAIFIACMGLFALSAFIAEQKTKEIGIRKVYGSNVSGIIFLLNNYYLRLVLLSNLLAWPLAWLVMRKWLQNFAYRIDQTWGVFVLSALTALVIAFLVVSYQSYRAAVQSPTQSLRYE